MPWLSMVDEPTAARLASDQFASGRPPATEKLRSMSLSPLLPAAGIAAAALARGAVSAVESGLSFASQLCRGDSPPDPPPVDVQPTRPEFEADLRDFSRLLQQRLAAAGVGQSGQLDLVSDGLGGVQVSGDHPDRARIEQTLNGDVALLARFQQLAEQAKALNPTDDSPDRRDFGLAIAGDKVATFFA